MLTNDLFLIKSNQYDSGNIQAIILLNMEHSIFKGHFPNQPVLPGVCMVQIIKELLELATAAVLQLQQADNIKFLAMIDPRITPEVDIAIQYQLSGDTLHTSAVLKHETTTFLKSKMQFVKLADQGLFQPG